MQIDQDEKIQLEFFWKAPYLYGDGWQVSKVNLTRGESNCQRYAYIDTRRSPDKEQYLNFIMRSLTNAQEKKCPIIEIPAYLIKSIGISVIIFKNFSEMSEIPVTLDGFLNVVPKKIYQIRIVYQDKIFMTKIEEKIFDKETKKVLRSKMMKFNTEKNNMVKRSNKKNALKILQKMKKALTSDNFKLDELSEEVLKQRFNEAQKNLENHKTNFIAAMKELNLITTPLEIRKILIELISVQRALNKKKIYF